MPKIRVTTRNGQQRVIDAEVGISLMQSLRDNGVDDVLAVCGGCCSCATCHVYVDSAFARQLPPMGEDEQGLLDASNGGADSRLSCQILVTEAMDGMLVTVAPED